MVTADDTSFLQVFSPASHSTVHEVIQGPLSVLHQIPVFILLTAHGMFLRVVGAGASREQSLPYLVETGTRWPQYVDVHHHAAEYHRKDRKWGHKTCDKKVACH